MVDVNEVMTETKAEYIKYALINPKYTLYVIDVEDLVMYIMNSMYVAVERFVILGKPLHIFIRVRVIDPCFMMKKIAKKKLQKHLSLNNLT